MKKLLLLLLFIGSHGFTQILQSEDFNALTVGDVAPNITGAGAPGQGGFSLFSVNFFGAAGTVTTTTSAAVTNAQIIDSLSANALSLSVTGPNGNNGGVFLYNSDLTTLWPARTAGNDFIEIEVDVNTNAISTSRNVVGLYLYDAAGSKVLVGFNIRAETKQLSFVAYSTPAGTNPSTGMPYAPANYNYSLAAAPGVVLPANTVVRIGVSYNKTTGAVLIKAPGVAPAGIALVSSAIGTDPAEIDFIAFSGSTTAIPNTSSASMTFDNLTVKATATSTLLLKNDAFFQTNFSVYPNPATDLVNITKKNNVEVNSISITDINGRIVKEVVSNEINLISIADLTAGIYLLKIVTAEGTGTTKLFKN